MTGWIVLGAALLLIVPAIIDAARLPNMRKLAWRNLSRRKSEAVLVTLGTLLGTAIIVASFVVGATIKDADLSRVYTVEGPLDEAVVIEDSSQLDVLTEALRSADLTEVDGILPILSMPTVMTTTGADPLGRPSVWFAEVDFDEARLFGGDEEATGFADAGPTPGLGEIVLIDHLASPLGVEVGDTVVVHAYGSSNEFTVSRIIERAGTAGWNSGYVAPGTIDAIYDPVLHAAARSPRAEVAISNTGDIFAGVELTDTVVPQLEAATEHLEEITVEDVKANTLENAAENGSEFTTLFSGIGSFAVIAGVLLIVNLFVMLAEERKTQLGILRAVGFKRNHVTRAFGMEGVMYALSATLVGTGAGVGIGWVLVQVIKTIFTGENENLNIGFAAPLGSLALGAGIGLGLSMITIWITALRIAKFNVIAAIRDLPNPPADSHKLRSALLSLVGITAGVGIALLGFGQGIPEAILAGPGIAAFAAIPLVRLFLGSSIGASIMGLAAIGWGTTVFTLFPDAMEESEIGVFVVQGLVLVAGAIVVSSSAQRLWSAAVDGLSNAGLGLSARLGLAYPLARKVRTGLLLGMFSLVIFMVSFLSVFSVTLSDMVQAFADDQRAGSDVIVRASSVNPIDVELIEGIDGVATVTPFIRAFTEFDADGLEEPEFWRVTGFDETLLANGTPKLSERAAGYSSDEAVFEAVLADSGLIIIDPFFLESDDPEVANPTVGDTVTILNDATGESRDLEVAGVMASGFIFVGSYMNAPFVAEFLDGSANTNLFFVTSDADTDADLLSGRMNAQLLPYGVDAKSFAADVEEDVSETLAIFRLFQGFLSLGLFIGVAGLAVVLIRAVRERRRSIGVLRALGYSEKVVRRAFLVEASFIAVQGVAIGIGLGLLTAYQVIVNSSTFGEADLSFTVPFTALAFILVLPTLASLAAAAAPAIRASRISPAVALRTD